MNAETHSQLANFIWSICNLLRGPYKRNEYRKVILPLTVLRRFDCILAPTKDKVLAKYKEVKGKPDSVKHSLLCKASGKSFYNLSRLDAESAFRNLASSNKKAEAARREEIAAGEARQAEIRKLLILLNKENGNKLYLSRDAFLADLKALDRKHGTRLAGPELKAVLAALGERDETAEICRNAQGNPEADADLRDTESVPLKENIAAYFKREVLPNAPDAWIDDSKTKVGYEIPLNRHFYCYEPPRALEEIETDIKILEDEILGILKAVTA